MFRRALVGLWFLAVLLCAGNAMASSQGEVSAPAPAAPESEPWVEYTAYHDADVIYPWFDNPKDVVTPWFENKFKLKVKELYWRSGQLPIQRINSFIATNSFPDVFQAGMGDIQYAISQGVAMDLTELIPKYMPNYWKQFTPAEQKLHESNGRMYHVWKMNPRKFTTENIEDVYNDATTHTLLVREDLLKKLGYKFTPLKEIAARCQAEGRGPKRAELLIDPPIATPDDFYTFLKKVKALNIKVDGRDLIPWSVRWSFIHTGSIFDFGHWQWDPVKKEAYGYHGSPWAKDYFVWLNKCYQEGLLDPDFIMQTPEQLQEKVNTGRVAVSMSEIPDHGLAMEALQKKDPEMVYHAIPWPQKDKDHHGYYDITTPGYYVVFLSSKLNKDVAIRLLKMWDYMYTPEGWDMLVWGPQEAGIWEMKDGKRVFKDPTVWDAFVKGADKGGPDQFGLQGRAHKYGDLWSKIAWVSGSPAFAYPRTIRKSYPPTVTMFSVYQASRRILSTGNIAFGDSVTKATYGMSEVMGKPNAWTFNDFRYKDLASLIKAKTPEEFDKAWGEVYQTFLTKTEYEKGRVEATEWFKMMGNK